MANKHPEWAIKHKRKGSELRLINGKYYLYEVTSKWDPEKKRARKITGKLLGKITKEEGFVESEKERLRKKASIISKITVKEYGVTAFITKYLKDYEVLLKKHFPSHYKQIMILAYGRLVHQSPMKNMEFHYHHSYMSERYKRVKLSAKELTRFLREFGVQREEIISFFKEFKGTKNNILFDGTDLLSKSKLIEITEYSKTKKGGYNSLTNLMFAFSVDLKLPLYYRLLPGNIKDIKAFKLSLAELGIEDASIIVDKGFYSDRNIRMLIKEGLRFIIPLKRNSSLINYEKIVSGDKKGFEGFFSFQGRIIWYYSYDADGLTVNVYLDEALKINESKDYLQRIEKFADRYSMKDYYERQYRFGTIAILHNTGKKPQEVYVNYKSRGQIEEMFDVFKNILAADSSYMQNEQALETWLFVNHIALHWYFKVYQLLAKEDLIGKYSPMDFVLFLKEIRKVKINNKWHSAEVTKKTVKLLNKLNIHIT